MSEKLTREKRLNEAANKLIEFIEFCYDSSLLPGWREKWKLKNPDFIDSIDIYKYKPVGEVIKGFSHILALEYGYSKYHLEEYYGDWYETSDIKPEEIREAANARAKLSVPKI